MHVDTSLKAREDDYKHWLRANYFGPREVGLITLVLKWEGSWWDTITASKQEVATVWTNLEPGQLAWFQNDINMWLKRVHNDNMYPVRLKHKYDTEGMPAEIEME